MKINGKKIADKIYTDLKKRVREIIQKNTASCLAIILVGDDPASVAYVRQKEIKGKLIDAKIIIKHFPDSISQSTLLLAIKQFNNDNKINGIIVQKPLPPQIDANKIILAINPQKDIDGFNPLSKFQPPLALAVLRILEEIFSKKSNFIKWLKSKNIVLLGKGETGGRPIINMFEKMGISPQIIDSKTPNPSLITKNADIIISAVGKPNMVRGEMIKKGVILISVGLSRRNDGKLHGDYDENEIKNIASFYTPELGGVGPVNVAMLLKNLTDATLSSH